MNKSKAVIAVVNSSDDTVEMLRVCLQHRGFTTVVTAHVTDIRKGLPDVPAFVRQHDPRVFIYDISIPYDENWRLLERLMKLDVMRGRRFVITTTNVRALDSIVREHTGALQIVGKPYDLEQVVRAVESALTEVAPGSGGSV